LLKKENTNLLCEKHSMVMRWKPRCISHPVLKPL